MDIKVWLPKELMVREVAEENLDGSAVENAGNVENADNDLPAIEGVDWESALMHLPDKELLLETVYDFYSTMSGEADFLQNCFEHLDEDKMLDSYCIKVHAMKSSAALIGINGLSEKAKALEMAAKDGDKEYICQNTEDFLNEWRSYKEKLSVCITTEEKEELSDFTIVKEKLDELKEAMDFMDIDMADEIMKVIRSYEYPEKISEKVERLGSAVVNLDVDMVNELIDSITDLYY